MQNDDKNWLRNFIHKEYSSPKNIGLYLALLVVAGMTLRFSLHHLHQIIEGDGVHYASLARIISHDGNFWGAANEYWSNLWPLVIAFFDSFLFHNIELSGRLASTFFGSLTVIPVYLLSREMFNKRTSLVAAALVVPQPYLLRFSVLLYTESFYTFIFAIALWLGIRLVKLPAKRIRWFGFGLVIGFGFLTRPEIQILAILFPFIALVFGFRHHISFQRMLTGLFIFCLVVMTFLSLRATLIWHYSGKWHFGFMRKATINLIAGDLFYEWSELEKHLNKFENGKFVNRNPAPENIFSFLWKNRKRIVDRMGVNVAHIYQSFDEVLPSARGDPTLRIISIILTGLGILWAILRKSARWYAILLISILLAYSAQWLLIFVLDRFVVPLTIIAIVFTGAGLVAFESAVFSLFKRPRLTVWPILPFIFVFAFIMRTTSWARHDRMFIWENDPVVQKEAGFYLKKNFPQKTRILTWGPHVPYYFYEGNPYSRSVQNIPWAQYTDLMAYVRKKKIKLLVLPEWVLLTGDFPTKFLVSEIMKRKDLKWITTIGKDKPVRIWIYKVRKIQKN